MSVDGDGHLLVTGVVGSADGDVLGHFVLNEDVDLGGTGSAEGLNVGIRLVELSALAEETADGLTGCSLHRGPLVLQVTGGAGVRAVRTLETAASAGALSSGDSEDGVETLLKDVARLLDGCPASDVEPVERDCAVLAGEAVAVDGTIGERCVDT